MRAANPIDVAIRTIPAAWFAPDRRIYWADMVLSAALGWSTFVAAMVTTGWTRAALLIVAAFALYRAVLLVNGPAADSRGAASPEAEMVTAVAGLVRRASRSHG